MSVTSNVVSIAAPIGSVSKVCRILHVSSIESDRVAMRRMLDNLNLIVHSVTTANDALAVLQLLKMTIVICDDETLDWRTLLTEWRNTETPPLLVVSSRLADTNLELEVFNRGGADLLKTPFDELAVRWVIGNALLAQQRAALLAFRTASQLALM